MPPWNDVDSCSRFVLRTFRKYLYTEEQIDKEIYLTL